MTITTVSIDRRTVPQVGRSARLELVFARREGQTVLAHGYAEPPLRVGRWFPDGGGAHMVLATSAPGVFGGDSVEQTITVEPHADVHLVSQSALQVHPSADGSAAHLRSTYRVAEAGRLRCRWDPVIPFAGAHLDQRIEVQLAAGARFYWSDALMSGRLARGERWQFASLAHELKVFCGTRLQYLERYRIVPRDGVACRRTWVAGEAGYFSTTLAARPVTVGDAERLHAELGALPGVQAAADALGDGLLVVRLMASSGVAFRDARALVDRWHARTDASDPDPQLRGEDASDRSFDWTRAAS